MKRLIAWSVHNPVAVNLITAFVLVAGVLGVLRMRREVYPAVPLHEVRIHVIYPGAGPADVEQSVVTRIEQAIFDIPEIDKLRSSAYEGLAVVRAEIEQGADLSEVMAVVKARIDAVQTFPVDAERPLVFRPTAQWGVLSVGLSGDVDEPTIAHWAAMMRDRVSELEGVSTVQLHPQRDLQIVVEVAEQSLRRHQLTFDAVVTAIRMSSLDLPAGTIDGPQGGRLRIRGQAFRAEEFAALPITARPDGTRVTVGDVATVVETVANEGWLVRLDGRPGAMIQVMRTGDQDALQIAKRVKDYVDEVRPLMPPGLEISTWGDTSLSFRARIRLMVASGLGGLLLVVLVLALFLRLRTAVWVSAGLLVAFLGMLAIAPTLDLSLNMISLFGFILVLGLLVDDAIIIGESVSRFEEAGLNPADAAIEGTASVSRPVIMAAMTTVVAFCPILFIPGSEGAIWASIGIVVIGTLLLSLGEALFLLPAHLAEHGGGSEPPIKDPADVSHIGLWGRLQRRADAAMQTLTERIYIPTLERGLRRPEIILAVFLAMPILTYGVLQSGWIKMVFFAPMEMDSVRVEMELTPGTRLERTDQVMRRIEAAADQMRTELGEDSFGHMVSVLGNTMRRGTSGDHTGFLYLELSSSETRAVAAEDVTRRWRELVGAVPDATVLEFDHSFGDDSDKIDMLLTHRDSAQLRAATSAFKEHLSRIEGVHDITSPDRSGEPELRLELLKGAEAIGVTRVDLARQVRQGFYGAEAQRIQRGRDDIRVMVRYPEDQRQSLSDLEKMRIRTTTGAEVPFGRVARVEMHEAPPMIQRTNRQRTFNVEAAVDSEVRPLGDILEHLYGEFLPALREQFPGLGVFEDGALERRTETLAYSKRSMFLSVLAIYILLAMTLRSYSQPLIILLAVPFGVVGSIAGHGVRGIDVTMLSVFGIVAAAGVVVNDALVYLDAANRFRDDGLPLREALVEAGRLRLRPIVLTSLTTFIGLLPITLQTSSQGQFLVPMAVSLASGVLFATVITLFLIPAVHVAGSGLATLVGWQPRELRAPPRASNVSDLPLRWHGKASGDDRVA